MLMLVLAVLTLTQGTRPSDTPLETALRRAIAASGAEVAVAYRRLDGRGEAFIDADKPFHAASTMKIPVMVELFRQAAAGALSLEDPLPVRNEFHSIVDGSSFKLSDGDDSDTLVYAAVGTSMTLRRLCELMITVSSNFAANLLIEKLGVDNIRSTVARLGANGIQVLRGVEDQKAFDKGLNNTTTARGLLVLCERMARGQAVDERADAAMIDVLKQQKFNDAIPAGVPEGTPVAHKTGNITKIHHDAGIVYAAQPYVLVLLVRGIDDQKKSASLMADLSRIVYQANQRVAPER
jgi:beta-lactamase class A